MKGRYSVLHIMSSVTLVRSMWVSTAGYRELLNKKKPEEIHFLESECCLLKCLADSFSLFSKMEEDLCNEGRLCKGKVSLISDLHWLTQVTQDEGDWTFILA